MKGLSSFTSPVLGVPMKSSSGTLEIPKDDFMEGVIKVDGRLKSVFSLGLFNPWLDVDKLNEVERCNSERLSCKARRTG